MLVAWTLVKMAESFLHFVPGPSESFIRPIMSLQRKWLLSDWNCSGTLQNQRSMNVHMEWCAQAYEEQQVSSCTAAALQHWAQAHV